jgi:hypothetical protein
MYIINRFDMTGAICKAFGCGYLFANRNYITWSESFALDECKSLRGNHFIGE